MLKLLLRSLLLLLLAWVFSTCIDPYTPKLSGYESLLVVEGVMTDDTVPYVVRLSHNIQNEDSIPERISDATVAISDETGSITYLENCGDGIYKTDPEEFTGTIGKTYSLHIVTSDDKEYISAPSEMLPVPGIEDIYYEKDTEFSNDQTEILDGIRLYIDTEQGSGEHQYLRWEYEETWKFGLADYKRYYYGADSVIRPIYDPKEFCFKTIRSTEILHGALVPGQSGFINRLPVCFIAPSESDRLTIQYSILVKQYSLSKEAYEFWNNLKQVSETGGSIFDKQPFLITSNITNVNDPDEKVLGYFQVSAVKQERKTIIPAELVELHLPWYRSDCVRFVVSPEDYPPPTPTLPMMTFYELYQMFTGSGEFTFVEPIYNEITQELEKLVFVPTPCSDCELTGFYQKPDWWIDLN